MPDAFEDNYFTSDTDWLISYSNDGAVHKHDDGQGKRKPNSTGRSRFPSRIASSLFSCFSDEQDVTDVRQPPSSHSTEDRIDMLVSLLSTLLQQVVLQRLSQQGNEQQSGQSNEVDLPRFKLRRRGSMLLDEVAEVINIGRETNCVSSDIEQPLSESVQSQLRLFVSQIASMYKNNPFHSLDHATHVTIAAFQLVQRVVARDLQATHTDCPETDPWNHLPKDLSESSNVLASDALAQFALVFSALIHDVDHHGVPNVQLAKEKPEVASKYQNTSIAEQNSIDLAWELLEDDSFGDLRACIFPTHEDCQLFRKMVVNVVMATDICEPALRLHRQKKWDKAFAPKEATSHTTTCNTGGSGCAIDPTEQNCRMVEDQCRKATVAMDLIMQAADISHTMQPFHIYCKWNQRLYHEQYLAYLEDRSNNDPTRDWYRGELNFFDNYVIPLAKKLTESGAFGPAGNALLENAERNRMEWQQRGQEVIEKMQETVLDSLNVMDVQETTRTGTSNPCNQSKNQSKTTSIKTALWSHVSWVCCRPPRLTTLHGKTQSSSYASESDVPSDADTEVDTDDEDDFEPARCLRPRAKQS